MSAKGVLTFEEIATRLRQIAGLLERPPWTDAVDGGLRVETVTTLSVLTTAENLTADCPFCVDPVIEEGQVVPPIDPIQGLDLAYDAKTGDRACYAFTVGARVS